MTSEMDSRIQRIADTLRIDGKPAASIEEALRDLLAVTDSRAVGLWRVSGQSLKLVGFRARADMPWEVRNGFAEATREVSLSQAGLGIVKAVLHQAPAVAHVEVGKEGLRDSASWLAKFEAVQSLAVPIVRDEEVRGVLAMSTANPFVENDDVWRLLTGIAERLGN